MMIFIMLLNDDLSDILPLCRSARRIATENTVAEEEVVEEVGQVMAAVEPLVVVTSPTDLQPQLQLLPHGVVVDPVAVEEGVQGRSMTL
jgi:hypothetical protein